MRVVLFLSCLGAAICGAAGFVASGAGGSGGARRLGSTTGRSRHAVASGSTFASRVCNGQLRPAVAAAARAAGAGCTPASLGTLRMGAADDGGGSDGSALAEARIVVQGQSTGGYFRAHARNEAHFNRNLCGALKELGQGRTEIIVEGKTSAIRSFMRWCKKGPGLSQQIQEVTVDWAEYTGIFDGFEVFPDESPQNKAAGVP